MCVTVLTMLPFRSLTVSQLDRDVVSSIACKSFATSATVRLFPRGRQMFGFDEEHAHGIRDSTRHGRLTCVHVTSKSLLI